jgi:hypothetical protein
MNDPNKDKLAPLGANTSIVDRRKIGGSSLHNRVAAQPLPPVQPKQSLATPKAPENPWDASMTATNRIGMMLDCSSSMCSAAGKCGKSKIDHLKDACQNFFQSCNFADTSVSIETFPSRSELDGDEDWETSGARELDDDPLAHLIPQLPKAPKGKKAHRKGLTNIHAFLQADVDSLRACGGTPMACAMGRSFSDNSLTRGIIVSDGEADSPQQAKDIARKWKEADIPIDTVHIGRDTSGEQLLKEIAEITGGMFIKFDNVENFAKAFKYLAPAYRAMLGSGSAAMLGAKEVQSK